MNEKTNEKKVLTITVMITLMMETRKYPPSLTEGKNRIRIDFKDGH